MTLSLFLFMMMALSKSGKYFTDWDNFAFYLVRDSDKTNNLTCFVLILTCITKYSFGVVSKTFFPEKGNKLPDQLSAHLYFGLNSEPWKYWNILSVFLTANTGWRKWHQFLRSRHWTLSSEHIFDNVSDLFIPHVWWSMG